MIELQPMELTDYDMRWRAMLAIVGITSKRDWVKVAKPSVHISNTTVLYQGVERLVLGVSAEKCEPGSLFVEFKRLPANRPVKVRHPVDTTAALEAIARVMASDPTFKPTAIPTKVWIAKLRSLARKGYLRGKQVSRTRFHIDWLEVKGLAKLDPELASAAHAAAVRFNNNTTLGMPVWPVKAWVAKPVPAEFIDQEGLGIVFKNEDDTKQRRQSHTASVVVSLGYIDPNIDPCIDVHATAWGATPEEAKTNLVVALEKLATTTTMALEMARKQLTDGEPNA